MRVCALPWGIAALVVCAATASAETPSAGKDLAAQRAREGEKLGNAKDFVGALKKFREAADLDPDTPAYACNVGMANYALNHYPRAHLWLTRCRNANGGSFGSSGVEQVFHFIENDLRTHDYTPISIRTSPPGARVQVSYYDSEGPSRAPITMYVAFGRYQVTIEHDGYEPVHDQLVATDRSAIARSYPLERDETATSGGGSDAQGTGTGDGGPRNASGAAGSGQVDLHGGVTVHRARKKWPLWLVGGGAVLGLTGGYAFYRAVQATDPDHYDGHLSSIRTPEIAAYTLWGLGGAAAAAGLYLYFRQPVEREESPPMSVAAAPTAGGGMVFLSWQH